VVVIALFYTESLDWNALLAVFLLLGCLTSLNLGGIRQPLPYILLGVLLWGAMLKSGVHATLAGIFLAFSIPMRPKYDPRQFLDQVKALVEGIRESYERENNIIRNEEMRSKIDTLSEGVQLVQAPAQVLENKMHLPSAYLVIPIFSLANAGIPIEWESFGTSIMHPVAFGAMAGLVLGKLIGVTGFTWVAVKWGLCQLPLGLNFKHIVGAGLIAGIGFTMSIFIAELGFAHHPEDLLMAKTGILLASLVAGISGYVWLRISCPSPTKT